MADLTYTATLDDKISPALKKIENNVQKVQQNFSELKTLIAGLAVGTSISNVIRLADSIQDISDATSVAIPNILGFQQAVQLNGGSAEQAQTAILKLTQTIGDAASGSKEAQLAFKAVGVSIADLQSLSEQDILAKTIKGLSQVQDAGTRVGLATQLLGKNFRAINIQGVAGQLTGLTSASVQYAQAIQQTAEMQNKLDIATQKFQLNILKAIQPMVDFINALDDDKIATMIESFVQMAAALTAIAVSLKTLETLGKIFAFIAGSVFVLRDGFTSLARTFSALGTQFRGFKKALQDGTPILEALGVTIGVLATKRIPFLLQGLGMLAKGFGGLAGVIFVVNEALKGFTDKSLLDYLNVAIDKTKEFFGLENKQKQVEQPKDTGAFDNLKKQLQLQEKINSLESKQKPVVRSDVEPYYMNQKKALEANVELFRSQGEIFVKNIQLQGLYNGLSNDTVEILTAQNDAYLRTNQEVERLQTQKRLLKNDETELASIYDVQIGKIKTIGQEQAKQAADAIKVLQQQRVIQDELNHQLDLKALKIRSDEAGKRLTEDLSLIGLYGEQLKKQTNFIEAQRDLRSTLNELQMEENRLIVERTKLGEDNFNREIQQLQQRRDLAQQIAQDRIKSDEIIRETNYQTARQFSTGWQQAYYEYMESATNSANRARQAFTSVTSNMESAIDRFVETGKFSFSDFARSIIQDLIKIELKAQAVKILQSIGGAGGIFSAIGSLLGFADGGTPPINKPSIVGERGPELFVPRQQGTIIPNEMMRFNNNRPQQVNNTYITNQISAIDSKSVAQLFAENRKMLLGTLQLAQKELPYGNR